MVTLVANNSAPKLESVINDASTAAKDENNYNELCFKLSSTLQSTLDLESTLTTFFEHIRSLMRCNGLHYENPDLSNDIQIGAQGRISANYTISSGEDNLGELRFIRDHKFAEAELAMLEILIGVLFYPLRNSLKYKKAVERSLIDNLTNIANRTSLDLNCEREIKLAKRHKKAMSILVIDIDHFKVVNDTYGHAAGDATLKLIAKSINQSLRETDQVFRYGGEEFVALLSETDIQNATLSAERIRENIEKHATEINGENIKVTVSIGISSLAMDDSFASLFDRADTALYQAKNGGRNKVVQSLKDQHKEIKRTA